MKRFFRWSLVFVAGLLVLFGILFAVLSIQPYVNDSDLSLKREPLAAEANAFATLEKAAAQAWWPDEANLALMDLVKGTNWNPAFAASALASNREALKLLDAAMAMTAVQVPEFQFDSSLPYLFGWKRLAQVAAIRANATFLSGRQQEAFQQALELVRLGRRLEEGQGGIIHYLVGSAVKAQGLSRMRAWAATTRLPPPQFAGIVAELERVPADSAPLAESLKTEYQMIMTLLSDVRSGRRKPGGEAVSFVHVKYLPVYNHGKTKRLFANGTRTMINGLDVPYSQAKLPDFDRRPGPAKLILSGNLAGEICFWLHMPGQSKTVAKRCQETADLQTTRLLLAMRAYQAKHGKLPASLADLTPDFIEAVPADPFDGEPLRYSADNKAIYSVGENLRDDGGLIVREKEQSRQLDIGCSVDF